MKPRKLTLALGLVFALGCAKQATSGDSQVPPSEVDVGSPNCVTLAREVCNEIGQDSDSCALITAKIREIPTEHCEQMLAQIDDIVDQLKAAEAANPPLSAEWQRKIAASDAPSFGPPDAKVTLVGFTDFHCPFCARGAAVTAQIEQAYRGRIRFVFRQCPLASHPTSYLAAEAVLAAHAQGKFWPYYHRLFQHEGDIDRSFLEHHATALGMNLEAFRAALDNHIYQERIDADLALGDQVGVIGTPTVFLNGKKVIDPTDYAVMERAVKAALAK